MDYATNPYNPLYLDPNESPLYPPLDGNNYHAWARSMKLSLISRNKLGFIDGSIHAPSITDPLYRAWFRCNRMVLSWIQHSVSETIVKSTLWFDQASDAWRDLRDRFSQGDVFKISAIQEDMHNFRQGNLDLSDYFIRLKVMWDELERLRPLPNCTCGEIESMKAYREQEYVITFLRGLNEQYENLRFHIMSIDLLPNMSTVFAMVMEQERQMNNVPFGF